jgi:hypothetical protein
VFDQNEPDILTIILKVVMPEVGILMWSKKNRGFFPNRKKYKKYSDFFILP